MTASVGWLPVDAVDDEVEAVLELVDDLAAARLTRAEDGDPDAVDRARAVLAEHDLWTLGVAEEAGGAGAGRTTTLLALSRLGGAWAALAWGSVQAHAAAMVLAGQPAWADLLTGLHGGAPVAVVCADVPGVDLTVGEGRVRGGIARTDPAGRGAHVVVLLDHDTAVVLTPDEARPGAVARRTGLAGALTAPVAVDVPLRDGALVRGKAVPAARAMLLVGCAAVAAGIAQAAADAALAYSRERVQFGAPLTALPTVRVSLAAQATAARTALLAALNAGLDDPAAAAGAAATACDLAIEVAAAAVQSHGGYGYMVEYRVEGLLRDAVSLRAASGAVAAVSAGALRLAGPTGPTGPAREAGR